MNWNMRNIPQSIPTIESVQHTTKALLPVVVYIHVMMMGVVGCKNTSEPTDAPQSFATQNHTSKQVELFTDRYQVENAQNMFTLFRSNMNKDGQAGDIVIQTMVAIEILGSDAHKAAWLNAAREHNKTIGMSREGIIAELRRISMVMPSSPNYHTPPDDLAVYFMALLAEYAHVTKQKK